MSMKNKLLKIVLPVFIVAAGILIMMTLIANRPAPQKEVRRDPGVLVETVTAEKVNVPIVISGSGSVEASREIQIIPQVNGVVMYVAPELNVGGFFKEGEVLFEIEQTDYKLALERAEASKAKAEFDLASIESQARIARSEWELLRKEGDPEPNPLVLYGPQLKNAQAALSSAAAEVEQAKVNLDRTMVRAPFNARIRSESIDMGQYVRTGTAVAVLAGTDRAEILVPLQNHDLQWIEIPRYGERQNGAEALVELNVGNRILAWDGHVVRSTGEVDPGSRMVSLVVEVDDPYGLKNKRRDPQGLATGTFVTVSIKGKILQKVFRFPRKAYRDGSTVWLIGDDGKLLIRKVVPLRIEKNEVIVSEGMKEGDRIILTNISGAANGMKLRTMKSLSSGVERRASNSQVRTTSDDRRTTEKENK